MVESFLKNWDDEFCLIIYDEDIGERRESSRLVYRDLPDWHKVWKEKWATVADAIGMDKQKNRSGRNYDYRRDCIKFSHKVAAITDAGSRLNKGQLIWLDADIYTHSRVSMEWLTEFLVGGNHYMAWLDRAHIYPECSFLVFNCSHPNHLRFIQLLRDTYESSSVFNYDETHDSYIFMKLVHKCVADGWFKQPLSISGDARKYHHCFVHSRLAEKLDHLKGPRKFKGRTPKVEVNRKEEYWR